MVFAPRSYNMGNLVQGEDPKNPGGIAARQFLNTFKFILISYYIVISLSF